MNIWFHFAPENVCRHYGLNSLKSTWRITQRLEWWLVTAQCTPANARTLSVNKLVLVKGGQPVCSQRQKVWAGVLLPKFSDTVGQWRIILILLAKWWPWEGCKKVRVCKKLWLGFTVYLEMMFNFLSLFTNCMLYPLFSGLLDLNGMNERSVLYDAAVRSSPFLPWWTHIIPPG